MRNLPKVVYSRVFNKSGFGSTPQVVDPNFKYYYTLSRLVGNELGNILKVVHKANSGNWNKTYDYNSSNNYLTGHGGTNYYTYDNHSLSRFIGSNMTAMQHLSSLTWDYGDNLKEVDLGGGGTAYYVYDASGERVRKVIENNGDVKDRIYSGDYEIFRSFVNGSLDLERETVHIMDDQKRIVKIDTKTVDNGSPVSTPTPLIRYQYSNHLESACLEIDDSANLISYEEYYPFGKSSYRSGRNQTEVQTKRYRYSGKERDDESGLYYYGKRYYAGWIGRFVSVDPMKEKSPGKTPYHYTSNNPVNREDPSRGQESSEENKKSEAEKNY